MENILIELWNGNISPAELFGNENHKMEDMLRLSEKNRKKLAPTLTETQNLFFERYTERMENYATYAAEQAFCNGFSLACKILTEALTAK